MRLKLRAERKAGKWLSENVKQGGHNAKQSNGDVTLPEGITRNQSSSYQKIASIPEEQFNTYVDGFTDGEVDGLVTRVGIERQFARDNQQKRVDAIRQKGVDLPQGEYATIVVDPPWPMYRQVEREVRPNQGRILDYPVMTLEEISSLEIPAADNSHLYLWVTQRFLPDGLEIAEGWGFEYQCVLTWVKNVGFTPFSWMYSTEHVLFCRRGSLPLLELGRRLDFSAPVTGHSRKPDVFYDLVKEVSPGPRLDMFARESHLGFESWGNEANAVSV